MSRRHLELRGLPGGTDGKELPAWQETRVPYLDQEDPLEEGRAVFLPCILRGFDAISQVPLRPASSDFPLSPVVKTPCS